MQQELSETQCGQGFTGKVRENIYRNTLLQDWQNQCEILEWENIQIPWAPSLYIFCPTYPSQWCQEVGITYRNYKVWRFNNRPGPLLSKWQSQDLITRRTTGSFYFTTIGCLLPWLGEQGSKEQTGLEKAMWRCGIESWQKVKDTPARGGKEAWWLIWEQCIPFHTWPKYSTIHSVANMGAKNQIQS